MRRGWTVGAAIGWGAAAAAAPRLVVNAGHDATPACVAAGGGRVATSDAAGVTVLWTGDGRELARAALPAVDPLYDVDCAVLSDGWTVVRANGDSVYGLDLRTGAARSWSTPRPVRLAAHPHEPLLLLFETVDAHEIAVVGPDGAPVAVYPARGPEVATFTQDGAAFLWADGRGRIYRQPRTGGPARRVMTVPRAPVVADADPLGMLDPASVFAEAAGPVALLAAGPDGAPFVVRRGQWPEGPAFATPDGGFVWTDAGIDRRVDSRWTPFFRDNTAPARRLAVGRGLTIERSDAPFAWFDLDSGVPGPSVAGVAVAASGDAAVVRRGDAWQAVDLATGAAGASWPAPLEAGVEALWTPTGLVSFDEGPLRLDSATGEVVSLESGTSDAWERAVSPDGTHVAEVTVGGRVRVRRVADGARVLDATFADDGSAPASGVAWESDQRLITGVRGTLLSFDPFAWAAGGDAASSFTPPDVPAPLGLRRHEDRTFALYDDHVRTWISSGSVADGFAGPTYDVGSRPLDVAVVGTSVLVADALGRVSVFSEGGGALRCAIAPFLDGTWAVVAPDGRFDASNGGDVPHLHWVVGEDVLPLDRLKARFYEPGLLAACVAPVVVKGEDGPGPAPGPTIADVAPPPVVDATIDGDDVTVRVVDRGGGVGRVIVRVDGKEVFADLRAHAQAVEGGGWRFSLRGLSAVDRRALNRVEVTAYDAGGDVVSAPSVVEYLPLEARTRVPISAGQGPHGAVRELPPALYAVVVGVADYAGDTIDLRYAGRDALDFGNALRLGAAELFDDVHVDVLSTEPGREAPTRAAVLGALDRVAQAARPQDVVVLYLAGHGVTRGGADGDFYVLLADSDGEGLDDPAVRDQVALSADALGARLAALRARKQFVVLDTCHSGGAVADLGRPRAVPGEQVRAIDRMKDRAGLFVLAGSSADAVSYEATRFRKGLLTYALLDGMRGAATRDAEMWDVSLLASHAADRVPLLARGLGGVQRPVVAVPNGGASFDIGRATTSVRTAIPLPVDRPVVLRSAFQDEDAFVDAVELGLAVDRALRDAAAPDDAPFVTVDAAQYADGVRVVGRYRQVAGALAIELRVVRGDQVTSESFEAPDVAAAALRVRDAVARALSGGGT